MTLTSGLQHPTGLDFPPKVIRIREGPQIFTRVGRGAGEEGFIFSIKQQIKNCPRYAF
jgi:hypothetical protein